MEECNRLILLRREAYYIKVKKRQISKLERLCQKNRGGCSNKQDGRQGSYYVNKRPNSNSTEPEDEDKDREKNKKQDVNPEERQVVNLSSQPLSLGQREVY